MPPQTLLQIFVFMLVAMSLGGLLYAALQPRLRASRRAERFEQIVALHGPVGRPQGAADDKGRKRAVEDTLREIEERQKAKARKHGRPTLSKRMRQAGLGWSKTRYHVAGALAGLATLLLALVTLRLGLLPSLGFGLAGALLLPHLYVGFRRKSRFKRFSAEFPNAVDVIVRGVKAGLPLVDCLKVVASEAQEPVRSEFRSMVEDQTIGMPLDEAVGRLAERVPLTETNFFAIVIAIQSRTGGSLSEALGNLSRVLRDRKKLDAKIRAMSAEAKASAGIIGALPVIVAFLVYLTSPDYILLLFQTLVGNVVLAACGLWMLIGTLVMRKMINFDF